MLVTVSALSLPCSVGSKLQQAGIGGAARLASSGNGRPSSWPNPDHAEMSPRARVSARVHFDLMADLSKSM